MPRPCGGRAGDAAGIGSVLTRGCAAALAVAALAGAAGAQEAPRLTQISARYNHTVLLRSDGRLLACGDNRYGQLGFVTSGVAALKASLVAFEGAIAVSTGAEFTVAVRELDGSVWAWGDNALAQLGDGGGGATQEPVAVLVQEGETSVPLQGVASVSAGRYHTVAVKSADKSLWVWGAQPCGGPGAAPVVAPYAVGVPVHFAATAVAAGEDFTLALDDSGAVYAWGCNDAGQLGNGGGEASAGPVPVLVQVEVDGQVQTQPLTGVASIAANGRHAIALGEDGTVWSWGSNQGFGEGTVDPQDQPYATQVLPLSGIEAVAAGKDHNLVLIEATESLPSAIWGWGDADAGRLGSAANTESGWWAPVQPVGGGWEIASQIQRIDAGEAHTVALLTDGSVWTWGGNDHGQLGDGTTDPRSTPVAVSFAPNLLVQGPGGERLRDGATLEVDEGDSLVISLMAFDAPGAVPGYSASFDGGAPFPEGASLTVSPDGSSATFRWMPPYLLVTKLDPSQRRYFPITFTATTAAEESASHSLTVCVVNIPQPPVAEADPEAITVDEGDVVTLDGSASADPDGGALQYKWTSDQVGVSCEPTNAAVCSFTAPPVGTGALTVTFTLEVKDDDNKTATDVVVVTVGNVLIPPEVTVFPSSATVVSGEVLELTGEGTDADGGVTSSVWTRPDGSHAVGNSLEVIAPDVAEPTPLTYRFTVTDNDGLTASADVLVTVLPPGGANEPPTVDSIVTPTTPVRVGELFTATAVVADDALGTAPPVVTWTWSDGTVVTDASPVQRGASVPEWTSTVERDALAADVYTVFVTATDSRGETCEPRVHDKYVVVYDPDGGFVSGGGTVQSPAGAVAGSEAAGQATFGFTAKYRKDAPAPDGTLNFKLKAAGIDFRAETYEWLTITGSRARVRGTGTLATESGPRDCSFLLSVNDGKRRGGGGGHKFRLKIWERGTNRIVYDNQWSSQSDADLPAQPLSGGTVVIQER